MSDHNEIPTVSRVLPDGTLIELVFDPDAGKTALTVKAPGAGITHVQSFTTPAGEVLIPYSATNNLIVSGCILLPSRAEGALDVVDLVDEIRTYLRKYALLSPAFADIAPYYVLLSWVYDAFNEVPYLRFKGGWGTGKTRRLLVIGSICYKPFIASGASTVSPIFHILDTFGGTLVLDEADFRASDATSELTKILNNGTMRGLPVLRTMTNRHRELNPQAFKVFGPKLVAMREQFSDRALESRFITEETNHASLPADMPIHLPNQMATDARSIRNHLLAWRLNTLPFVRIRPERAVEGASARTNQMALPLLSLVDDEGARRRIVDYLKREAIIPREVRKADEENRVLFALRDAFAASANPRIAEITALVANEDDDGLSLSPKAVGSILRTRFGIATLKMGGVFVVPNREREAVRDLCDRRKRGTPAAPASGDCAIEADYTRAPQEGSCEVSLSEQE